jgi:hypothetical protein
MDQWIHFLLFVVQGASFFAAGACCEANEDDWGKFAATIGVIFAITAAHY